MYIDIQYVVTQLTVCFTVQQHEPSNLCFFVAKMTNDKTHGIHLVLH